MQILRFESAEGTKGGAWDGTVFVEIIVDFDGFEFIFWAVGNKLHLLCDSFTEADLKMIQNLFPNFELIQDKLIVDWRKLLEDNN